MNKIDFNVYDMVVIEDENGSIYQECIKEIRNISDHYPTIQQIICNDFVIDCDMKDNDFEYIPHCMICNKGRDKKKYFLLEVWQQKKEDILTEKDGIVKTKVYMRTYDNYLHLTNEQMKMTPAEILGIVDKKEEVNLSEESKKEIEDTAKKIIEEYNQKDIDLTNECCDCEDVKVENNPTKDCYNCDKESCDNCIKSEDYEDKNADIYKDECQEDYNVYGSKLKDVRRIRELEKENKLLKEIIGEMVLEKRMNK